MNNDNNQNELRMSRNELSDAYDDLLRNFTESEPIRPKTTPRRTVAPKAEREPVAEPVAVKVPVEDMTEAVSAAPKEAPAKKKSATTEKTPAGKSVKKTAERKPSQRRTATYSNMSDKQKAKIDSRDTDNE